ncbi:hypothetical protein BBJ28_00013748 [Nothophytophthora sp. Chile5]|nr:hypothetical protein BBJ28_00013748 [Nothophytophthora sp. Chile5]
MRAGSLSLCLLMHLSDWCIWILFASNNKFYMGQLIENGANYVVFRKWGRVGAKTPQSSAHSFSSLEVAQKEFKKAFASKSGNKWPLEQPFVRKKGKYVLVGALGGQLDDGTPEDAAVDADEKMEEKATVASTLPQIVQDVVQVKCKMQLFLLADWD